ncbi:MAG: tetratricopeptide repeat protein [Deltaproteobacteria bacterium]|nr:tetratricopeptide repeat protein [Deltaproteobacteria bacterium]
MPSRISDLVGQKRFGKALSVAKRLVTAAKRDHGRQHPATMDAFSAVGLVLLHESDHAGAARAFRKALHGREKAMGPDSREVEATLCNLGYSLLKTGDFHGALECFLRIIETRRKYLPEGHPAIASAMIDAGFACKSLGELEKAEAMYSRAVEIAEKERPRGHYDVTVALDGLAKTLMATGRLESALPLLGRARENVKCGPNPDGIACNWLHATMGRAYAASGDLKSSRDAWREALRTAILNYLPNDPRIIMAESRLGLALWETGEHEEAISHLGNAASASRIVLGSDHKLTILSEYRLELVSSTFWLNRKGIRELLDTERATADIAKDMESAGVPEPLRDRFLGLRWLAPGHGGPGDPAASVSMTSSKPKTDGLAPDPGSAAFPSPAPGEAVFDAAALLAVRERELGPRNEDTLRAGVALGNALLAEDRMDEAEDSYANAYAAAVKSLGPRSPAALGALCCLKLIDFMKFQSR